jgi:hypothetical protein
MVRPHVDRGGHGSPGSNSIASPFQLNTTFDFKLTHYAGVMVKHHVQASLALKARVELVEQFADPDGEIRLGRATAYDGDRLFKNLL